MVKIHDKWKKLEEKKRIVRKEKERERENKGEQEREREGEKL